MRIKSTALSVALASAIALSLPALAQTVDGPTVEWNISTWGNKRAFTAGMEKTAELVAERTGGKFTMKIHYGEALSKSRENLDGLSIGAFQGASVCGFYHPGKNPAWSVLTLPFLPFSDWNVSRTVRDNMMKHPALVADMDRWNAISYMSGLIPPNEAMGRGKPPATLSDWKGMRVRAGGGLGDAMEILGAVPTTVPAPDVYTSLERGTIEAAVFPFTYAFSAYKLPEISTWYTSNMSLGVTECWIVFGKTAYGNLPQQYKDLLEDIKDAAYEAQIAAYVDIDKKNVPVFREKLQELVYTDEQLAELRRVAGQPVWDKWVAENQDKFDARGLLDALLAEIEKAQKGT
ncbi:TRAP transporter substrate-binding protein DctP [Futiania mangrovi]|uniref:TRAP transporter substrate-binding protein DctP n=1 Tax=Futiania mangrovi TaxID=2959716 RepID=A0A9J6P7Y4_9PROT|nr:TRAP transporter substrate-binding protein DctP [Futiania mangrovii]MCP1335460.1 TRAP transporter substrate-binding protein DctP [Futiania mangrovii]